MKNTLLANNSGTFTDMFLLMCSIPYGINPPKRGGIFIWQKNPIALKFEPIIIISRLADSRCLFPHVC